MWGYKDEFEQEEGFSKGEIEKRLLNKATVLLGFCFWSAVFMKFGNF